MSAYGISTSDFNRTLLTIRRGSDPDITGYGKLTPPPPKTEEIPRPANWRGELEPRFEGDTEVRYSNPSAARLGELSQQAAARADAGYYKPGVVNTNIRRDGYVSIKPNNLLCDSNGRNVRF